LPLFNSPTEPVKKKKKSGSVSQKKKSGTASSRKRGTASAAKTRSVKTVQMKQDEGMSAWQRNTLAVLLVVVFSFLFYYFFIRPYEYRWKPCNGLKDYGVCIPYGYQVHGIDVSHYQGRIDWQLLQQHQEAITPLQFVFMKATEGGDHGDTTFASHFANARAHGFIRGAYHFFIPGTDALRQAEFFIQTVKLDTGDLPPVLDVEVTGRKSKQELQQGIIRWLNRVEAHYGVKPILYTSYKFKKKYLNDSVFNAYPYWIAHYYVDSVRYEGRWDFWQHTDVGSVPGIEEEVDLNVFNGSLADLKALTIQKK
jgi:lysozyme